MRVAFVLLMLVSCVTQAELVVSNGKVRLLPPGLPNTSAYFTIENTGTQDRYLVGGRADFVQSIELHNHIMEGEVMRMIKQEKVKIPAGESVEFAPGGLHLMLFGLKAPLTEDAKVQLSLQTQDANTIDFEAQVVRPGQEGGHAHHHH